MRKQGLVDEIAVLEVGYSKDQTYKGVRQKTIDITVKPTCSGGGPIEDGKDPTESADSSSSFPSTGGRVGNLETRACIAERYKSDMFIQITG